MADIASAENLRTPFAYPGGKGKVASLVWERFGDPATYIEPFFGSGAVLLQRPTVGRHEIVNDLDCNLANFWRAVKYAPDRLAEISTGYPPDEITLHARHRWLYEGTPALKAAMIEDVEAHDVERAAWWLWGISMWLGPTWMNPRGVKSRQIPKIALRGGIHCYTQLEAQILMRELSSRFQRTAVCTGDWSRICTDSFLSGKPTAVFLDPPYAEGEFFYAETEGATEGKKVTDEVVTWAIEKGESPNVRIAFCGYAGTAKFPDSWVEIPWTAGKGFSYEGNENRFKERIWFSPHCLKPVTGGFDL